MGKRFTETSKWGDPWFRQLPPKMKVFWEYVRDNCDCAGVWVTDWGLASFCIGQPITELETKKHFDGRVFFFGEDKMWILKFIKFQYGTLSTECKPHNPVFTSLKKHLLLEQYLKGIDTLAIPLAKGIDTLMDKDKEQDQDLGKGSAEGKPKFDKSDPLFQSPDFVVAWDAWDASRTKPKLTDHARALNLATLKGICGSDTDLAIRIVNQTIENGWKGFFPLKEKSNGQNRGSTGGGYESSQERKDRKLRSALDRLAKPPNGNVGPDHQDVRIVPEGIAGR